MIKTVIFKICLAVLFCFPMLVTPAMSSDEVTPGANVRSIGDFLDAKGQVNIEDIRQSGYEGSLGANDFDVHIDPLTGKPEFSAKPLSDGKSDPDDIYWTDHFSCAQGVNHPAYAIGYYNNEIIVGGWFSTAAGIEASRIAAWDGYNFKPLGVGIAGTGTMKPWAMAIYNGKLIVAGNFGQAGGLSAYGIAAWDGSSWSTLGSGLVIYPHEVRALVVYDGKLIAGGNFAGLVKAWNGSTWSDLGSGLSDNTTLGGVKDLAVYDGKLIAVGSIDQAGDVSVYNIAVWNGSSWSGLPFNNAFIYGTLSATVYGGDLIVGSPGEVVRWNGSSWAQIGSANGNVMSLVVHGGQLIAAGDFTSIDGVSANRVAAWDGSDWSPLGSGMNDFVWLVASCGGQLFACGEFTEADGKLADHVAYWDGSSWSGLYTRIVGEPEAFAVYDGKLIVGGYLLLVPGNIAANCIAAWDGTSWSALGSGVSDMVNALAVYNGDLYAGGQFESAGGASAKYIAKWNGSNWTSVGSGMNFHVRALQVYDDKLIAGGGFTTAGGMTVNCIAAWNGSSWGALGSGMNQIVRSFTLYNGDLIAGGAFTTAGGIGVNHIARWDGSSWHYLGTGINGQVLSLAVYENELIAGGNFTMAGDVGAERIARWNGSSWAPLGDGIGGHPSAAAVWDLAVYNDKLIATGHFTTAGSKDVGYIAAWDGSEWSALGSGLDGAGAALHIFEDSLIVGGYFETAGLKPTYNIARWSKFDTPTGVGDDAINLLPNNISLRQNYPNPFNLSTSIEYSLPVRNHVTIAIYNLLGQKVKTLVDEPRSAGLYRIGWNGRDDKGTAVSTGIYLCRFSTGDIVQTRKMLLLK